MMRGMVIDMNDEQLRTLADLQDFLDGTVAMDLALAVGERYEFIARTVRRFGYGRLKRGEKAVVLRFLERVSGYSRQQLTRLVKRGCERLKLAKRYRGLPDQLCAPLHGCRCAGARPYRHPAWHAIWLGDQETHGARLRGLRRWPLRAPGDDLGGTPVQPAEA